MISSSLKTKERVGDHPPVLLPYKDHAYIDHGLGHSEEITLLFESPNGTDKVRRKNGTDLIVRADTVRKSRVIEPQWENYHKILAPKQKASDDDFSRFLANTLVIAGLSIIGQALSSALVGWGFARLRFAGKNVLFMVMLATMMIPGEIGMIPTFMIFRRLGWIDTFLPLIVPAWLGSAFFAFLYRQFFMGIPMEMDEAAKVDGAGLFRIFWQVLLPMAKPVTVTVAVYTFLGTWNSFLGPLIYINSDYKRTLSLALAKYQSAYGSDVPAILAGATLMLIPVVIIYFFSQRALVQGMVVTGVKG